MSNKRLGNLSELFEHDFVRDVAEDYAEPGYSRRWHGRSIVTGNWNDRTVYDRETGTRTVVDDTPSRLANVLERLGVELEWSDEWARCDECYRLVRTAPDSHSWKPYYVLFHGEIACGDCIREDPAAYIDDMNLIGNASYANTVLRPEDLRELGFEKADETFYSGLHRGMTDDPQTIVAQLGDDVEWLFDIAEPSQFYIGFNLWTRPVGTGDED